MIRANSWLRETHFFNNPFLAFFELENAGFIEVLLGKPPTAGEGGLPLKNPKMEMIEVCGTFQNPTS